MELQVVRLNKKAKIPTYAHDTDAGMDLFAAAEVSLAPGERSQIPTGIALAVPKGFVGLVWDKSGLSHRCGLKTLGGVVDADYRGEIVVGMVNLGEETYVFKEGDKVAQILIQKVEHADLVEVDTLDETIRGEKGFGSTGN